ncbi:M48 family metallopeptidase [Woodsholea maritima]|uniref:M48 family metallopeptidase n=1 Tax=Woodsholea maritima TaxID=240237 RepID=UPI00037A8502|nr:SprT family zinc-dependent metalloprotease [Woodsholea maritima]
MGIGGWIKRDGAKPLIRDIDLHGTQVRYTLQRSNRRRTIGLKIGADGLVVILPPRTPEREGERVLRDKADWVLSHLKKWRDKPRADEFEGRDGERIGYLGSALVLRLHPYGKARTRIERQGDELHLYYDESLHDTPLRAATLRRALMRWRKGEALAYMAPRLESYAQRLGVEVSALHIREQNRRWGSCASDGSIRMNARLMAYPAELIDYVCAHEACHLIEMNHSPRFYALLARLMPDHAHRRAMLMRLTPPGVVY